MNTCIYALLLVLSVCLMEGCAFMNAPVGKASLSQPITSFKDPAYNGMVFRRVAVLVDTANLQWRHALETELTKKLLYRDMSAVEGYRMLAPTRSWDDAARLDTLAKYGVDAYLRLVVDNVEVSETTTPVTTTTTVNREKKPPLTGHRDSVEQETVTTRTDGGTIERRVRVHYKAILVDVKSGNTAWMALDYIDNGSSARMASFCDEISSQLLRDALVARIGT